MSIKRMAYQFRLQANRVDSNQSQKLELPAIIDYLNRAQMQLLKTRFGGNNNYRKSFEEIQKRIDEWRNLIVPHKQLKGTPDKENKLYSFDLKEYPDYLFLLRVDFFLTKKECKKKRSFVNVLVQTDDLNINLDNPNTTSNFEWREINYRLAQENILAYTDSSFSFSIDTAKIDYLRYPKEMDIAGYVRFDASASKDVDCELPDFLQDEIVNEAVLLFKTSLGHPDAQSAMVTKTREE